MINNYFETPIRHPLTIERRRIGIHSRQTWISHYRLIDLITMFSGLEDDPCKNNCLILMSTRHFFKRHKLLLIEIISRAFNIFQSTMLFPN